MRGLLLLLYTHRAIYIYIYTEEELDVGFDILIKERVSRHPSSLYPTTIL